MKKTLSTEIMEYYNDFIANNDGRLPNLATVKVKHSESGKETVETICITNYSENPIFEDDILYYVSSVNYLSMLAVENNWTDFVITDIIGFDRETMGDINRLHNKIANTQKELKDSCEQWLDENIASGASVQLTKAVSLDGEDNAVVCVYKNEDGNLIMGMMFDEDTYPSALDAEVLYKVTRQVKDEINGKNK